MNFKNLLSDAINGDITAFSQLYARVYEKIYYVAYYSLANADESVQAVRNAANAAYESIDSCKSAEDFNELFLKKTCEQIIGRYREYRKTSPKPEADPSFIKAQMNRLTDAERLTVMIWSVFDLEPDRISKLTGLARDVIAKKLESGKRKLEAKL